MSKSIRRRLSGGSDKGTDPLARYLYTRFNTMHKCVGDIKDSLKEVLLKKQSEINKNATLANKIGCYAEQESPGIRTALTEVQKAIVSINMSRQQEYDRLVTRFYQPIKLYKVLIANTKEEVRARDRAKENEESKQKKLSTIQVKDPGNRAKISKGRLDLQAAATEVTQADSHMREAVRLFEQKKIADMKTLFLEFIHAEMSFHARALEGFTQAYKAMEHINETEDMSEILVHLQQSSMVSDAANVMGNMGMMDHMNINHAIPVNNEFGIPGRQPQPHARAPLIDDIRIDDMDDGNDDIRVPDANANGSNPSWNVVQVGDFSSESEDDTEDASNSQNLAW